MTDLEQQAQRIWADTFVSHPYQKGDQWVPQKRAIAAVEQALAFRAAQPGEGEVELLRDNIAMMREVLIGIDEDYMTSEAHHPGYVLIPTAKFEQLRRFGKISAISKAALAKTRPDREAVEIPSGDPDMMDCDGPAGGGKFSHPALTGKASSRAAIDEAFEQAHALIQEAKGIADNGSVTDHLDFAEHWLRKAAALLPAEPVQEMREGKEIAESANCSGWIVTDGGGETYRTWQYGMSGWTKDRSKATRYARRKDAEAVHAEDEDAWRVIPFGPNEDGWREERERLRAAIPWLEAIRDVVREAHFALDDSEDRTHEDPPVHAVPHENAVTLEEALVACENFALPNEIWDGPGPLVTRVIDMLAALSDPQEQGDRA